MTLRGETIRNRIDYLLTNNIKFKIHVEDNFIDNIITAKIHENMLVALIPYYDLTVDGGSIPMVAFIPFESIDSIVTFDKITATSNLGAGTDSVAQIRALLMEIKALNIQNHKIRFDDLFVDSLLDSDFTNTTLISLNFVFAYPNELVTLPRWVTVPYENVRAIYLRVEQYKLLAGKPDLGV